MVKSTIELIRQLFFGYPPEQFPQLEGIPSPPQLEPYYKVSTIKRICTLPKSLLVDAAVCRAVLTPNEDDRVRTEALQQAMSSNRVLAETLCIALLFDDDEEMRLAAIEALVVLGSEYIAICGEILENEESLEVRSLLREIAAGREISLYRIDPIGPPSVCRGGGAPIDDQREPPGGSGGLKVVTSSRHSSRPQHRASRCPTNISPNRKGTSTGTRLLRMRRRRADRVFTPHE